MPSTITRYEKNERAPKISTLKKISEVLNVSIDYLLDRMERY